MFRRYPSRFGQERLRKVITDPPTADNAAINVPNERVIARRSSKKAEPHPHPEKSQRIILGMGGFETGNMLGRLLVRRGICYAPESDQELNI